VDDSRDVGQQTDPIDGPTAPTLSDETDTAGDVAEPTDDGESDLDVTTDTGTTDQTECSTLLYPSWRDRCPYHLYKFCPSQITRGPCEPQLYCAEVPRWDEATGIQFFDAVCVECLSSAYCPDERPYCDVGTYRCLPFDDRPLRSCTSDADCYSLPRSLRYCHPVLGKCSESPDCEDFGSYYDNSFGLCRMQDCIRRDLLGGVAFACQPSKQTTHAAPNTAADRGSP